jgi:hypothetical protein
MAYLNGRAFLDCILLGRVVMGVALGNGGPFFCRILTSRGTFWFHLKEVARDAKALSSFKLNDDLSFGRSRNRSTSTAWNNA